MGKIREYKKKKKSLEKAVKNAIEYCIEKNILKEFLEAHSSEVFNMLLTEWNQDEAIEVAREEERQYFLELLDQGLTIEEIKQRLKQEEGIFRSS
jgi:hypothetical protein